MTANTYDNDSETLSALFDGALQGDAARFALKRMGHDEQWRRACGRWQLYGDVLRGQSIAVAAGDLAERVAAAVAHETPMAMPAATSAGASTGGRRGWIGGALAASVAVAALFVARPFFSGDAAPTGAADAPVQMADVAAQTPAAPAADTKPAQPTAPAPDSSLALGAAAVAVAEVPRRAIERRSNRSQSQRAALRASRREAAPLEASAVSAPAVAVASAEAGANAVQLPTASNPFQPQHAEPATRPWPRAVLPQYPSAGGLTASYGGGNASPSFYPFEPQPSQDAVAADSPSPQP